jgi:hypothetical protein
MVNSESIDSVYMFSLQAMKVDCSLSILKIILHLSLTRCASMMIAMMRMKTQLISRLNTNPRLHQLVQVA